MRGLEYVRPKDQLMTRAGGFLLSSMMLYGKTCECAAGSQVQ